MKASWGKMAEEYLSKRETLALCIQLIDSRHRPTTLDLQLHDWLVVNDRRHVVVATKSDKLSANELSKQKRLIETAMDGSKVLVYSSSTAKGRDLLWSEIIGSVSEMVGNKT
jgi:GTP-binding protein